jgi:hypothetical protein
LTKWTLLGNPPRGQKDGLPCKHFADEHPRHGRTPSAWTRPTSTRRTSTRPTRLQRTFRPLPSPRIPLRRAPPRPGSPRLQNPGRTMPGLLPLPWCPLETASRRRWARPPSRQRLALLERRPLPRTRASARCVVSTSLLHLLTSPGRSCLQCPSLCRRRTTRTTMWTRTATPTMTRTTSPSSTRAARAPTTST